MPEIENAPLCVSISGGIAVGKTTLARHLSSTLPNCQVFIEHPGRNPYLADFYQDMARWAFQSRIAMLAMFASHYCEFEPKKEIILLDRCFYELIAFANLHVDLGNMSARDFGVYKMLYDALVALAPPVDLILYLSCSSNVALERAKHRQRAFERELTIDYVEAIEEYYEQWLATLPKTTSIRRINTDAGVDPVAATDEIVKHLRR